MFGDSREKEEWEEEQKVGDRFVAPTACACTYMYIHVHDCMYMYMHVHDCMYMIIFVSILINNNWW